MDGGDRRAAATVSFYSFLKDRSRERRTTEQPNLTLPPACDAECTYCTAARKKQVMSTVLLYFIALCFLSTFQSPYPSFRFSAAADETLGIIHLVFCPTNSYRSCRSDVSCRSAGSRHLIFLMCERNHLRPATKFQKMYFLCCFSRFNSIVAVICL